MSHSRSMTRPRPLAALMILLLLLTCFGAMVFTPGSVEGVGVSYLKYHSDNPDTNFPVYEKPNDYTYLRTEFTNNMEYIITGAHFMYKTTASSPWNGIFEIEDWKNKIQYDLSVPSKSEETAYYETFNGPKFMITTSTFTMSLRPNEFETNTIRMSMESLDISQSTHTYYKTYTDDWTPLSGMEFVLSSMVEPIVDLESGDTGSGGSIDGTDNLDLYRVLLVGNKTYTFTLKNPSRGAYSFKLYETGSIIDTPLIEKTSNLDEESFTYSSSNDSYYYLMVEYPNYKSSINYQVTMKANIPPTARIDGDTLVNVNQTVRLSAENSTDDDGDHLKYEWDFDDSDGIGVDATKTSPSHVYRTPGTYTITLVVSDGMETDMTHWTVRVNAPPRGSISIDGIELNLTTRLNFDQEYKFLANFTDPDNDEMNYDWDFGDGEKGTSATTTHTFTDAGEYTIIVKVKVSDLADEVLVSEELTFNQLPTATLEEPIAHPKVGKNVEFEGLGIDVDGTIVEYRWDFDGDGTIDDTTTDNFAKYKYKKPGTYTVFFYAVDENGGIGKANLTIDVKKPVVEEENNSMGLIIGGVLAIIIVVVLLIVYLKVIKPSKPDEVSQQQGQDLGSSPAQAGQVGPIPQEQINAQQGSSYENLYSQPEPQAQQYDQQYGQQQYGQQQYGQQQYGQQQYGQQQYGQQQYGQQQNGQQQYGQQQNLPQQFGHQPAQHKGPNLVPPPKPGQRGSGPSLVPPPKPAGKSAPPRLVPPPRPPG